MSCDTKDNEKIFVGQVVKLKFMVRDADGAIVDLSASTTNEIIIKRIGAAKLTKTAVMSNGTGTDGYMEYDTLAADLDVMGTYKVQGIVTVGANVYPTNIVSFQVYPRI